MFPSTRPRPQPRLPRRRTGFLGLAVCLAALLPLLGCARPEILFPDIPPIDPLAAPMYGMAQICILRPHTWAMARTVLIEDNGHLVGATRGPSYFCYAAQIGAHTIDALDGTPKTGLDIKVAAGQRVFIHHRVGLYSDRLNVESEAQAVELLDKCDYGQLADSPARAVYSESLALPAR